MCWLAKVYDFLFGCHHSNLSRVFTIGGHTYIVCCLCGIKFPYSLDSMSISATRFGIVSRRNGDESQSKSL
jgi:hypothetical protein